MSEIVSRVVEVYVYRLDAAGPQFLVLRRAPDSRLAGTWQTVFGHIDPDETAYAAAQRELAEETALTSTQWHQLESVNTFFLARADEIHMCPGFAARVELTVDPKLNREHDEFIWLPAGEAQARFHWPGQQRAVTEICDLIIPGNEVSRSLRLP